MSLVRPVCEYGPFAWSPYTQKDIICVESVQRRAARFVCNDYCRSSSVSTMLSNLGWQDLETRRKINDLTMFFKITTGNVRISFSNDLREVHCPYLTRGSLQQPFQFQRYSSTINAHKYSFFVRTVPAWNALCPVSVRADSVAVFHSSICNNFTVLSCSIELGQKRDANGFFKVLLLFSHLLISRHPVQKSKFGANVKIPKHAITLIYALKSAREKLDIRKFPAQT